MATSYDPTVPAPSGPGAASFERAPAKLTVGLRVVGVRADGLHLVDAEMVTVDLFDDLEITEGPGLDRLEIRGATGLPVVADDDNLVRRALRLVERSARVVLTKRIPAGAGLGGGSSDAATTLLALNRLWGLNWSREQLLRIAVTLGADVPFFVGGRNAWVEGIGEQLTPIAWPPLDATEASKASTHQPCTQWLAVVKPATPIPTSAIFNSSLLARDTKHAIVSDFLAASNTQAIEVDTDNKSSSGSAKSFMKFGKNDLQKPAQAYSNEVSQALELLSKRFGNSRMTGSGSAVFADAGYGPAPAASMPDSSALPAEWVGRMCQCLSQHPLLEWAN